MANATVSRIGQSAQAGAVDALFLEVFSGMVLEKFDTLQVTKSRTTVRQITNGKSAQFPLTWEGTASYHTPGTEIVGTPISHAARTISIEEKLIADAFIDRLDDAMNHYAVKEEYAHQLGQALANAYDSNNFRSIWAGAGATHALDSGSDGENIATANMSTVVAEAKASVFDAAQALDEKNVPKEQRTCAVLPLIWYMFLEDGEFLNRDYGNEGSQTHARLTTAVGLDVVVSNNIPTSDESGGVANVPDGLEADFSEYVGAVFHKSACATVELLGMKTESEYDIRRQGTLFVASYAIGQGYLRTESCVRLRDTAL